MSKTIPVETTVAKDIKIAWECWNTPEHIKKWAHASDDWECTAASSDLRVGGRLSTTMAAKDKSMSFDLPGTYTDVDEETYLAYKMDDGRVVTVTFMPVEGGTHIIETFEMENINPEEMQRGGWQAILDNFKKYVESL
jgi:uncharacterized protein YndB with AHSA1/START domain